MTNVPKSLIIDVIPAYLADDVSDDTRKLVEAYAETDEEIAALLNSDTVPTIINKSSTTPGEVVELEAIQRVRRSLRRKMAIVAVATACILLLPLTAMNFTSEVNWDVMDFIVMGAMLLITGATIAIASQKLTRKHFRVISILVVIAFLWLWAELAVGVFTNWGS